MIQATEPINKLDNHLYAFYAESNYGDENVQSEHFQDKIVDL